MNERSQSLSDFSKHKLFEVLSAIEKCIFAFYATPYDAEDEYFDLLWTLDKNDVAIPEELMDYLKSFVYEDLKPLVSNPTAFMEQLPPKSDTLEGTRERNAKWNQLEQAFRDEYYNPLKNYMKPFLVNT